MSASGKPAWDALFEPKVPGFRKVPLNDLAAADAAITDRTAAVMVEPIQGEAGVFVAADDYLAGLREITRQRGVLCLRRDPDRHGPHREAVRIRTRRDPSGRDDAGQGPRRRGGGGRAARRAEASCFEYGEQGGTFNGNLIAAGGLAVLETLTAPGFLERVVETGAYLAAGLSRLAARHGFGAVRGRGLLLALDLKRPQGPAIVEAALHQGLLLNAPRPDSLRFMPALTVTSDEIDQMLAILDEVCGALA